MKNQKLTLEVVSRKKEDFLVMMIPNRLIFRKKQHKKIKLKKNQKDYSTMMINRMIYWNPKKLQLKKSLLKKFLFLHKKLQQ